jgi:3',5'-nucleoside bisphosphate phosphatase
LYIACACAARYGEVARHSADYSRNKMLIDLHTHTTASDGELQPCDLLARAVQQGLTHIAITDHDTTDAYRDLAVPAGIELISGIEFSSRWRGIGVHIVGLNIDLHSAELHDAITQQQAARESRAREIARKLMKTGIDDPLPAVTALADGSTIGRPHFARHLVAIGKVKSVRDAFKKYLGAGKLGDVKDAWPDLYGVVRWIEAAGGVAVLAHPAHYRLTNSKLRELVTDFRAAGGRAIEVVSGTQEPATTRKLAGVCTDFGLHASIGSDFHRPDARWADLGRFAALPEQCPPVWQLW